LILCAGKKRETVEYLNLGTSGIHVAEYLTELPSRELLAARLHEAVRLARLRLAQANDSAVKTTVTKSRKKKSNIRH
jgi:hypothetical protein